MNAQKLSDHTGIKHEVVHIIPLNPRNKMWCGLNVDWNLRVVPLKVNRTKSDGLPHHSDLTAKEKTEQNLSFSDDYSMSS